MRDGLKQFHEWRAENPNLVAYPDVCFCAGVLAGRASLEEENAKLRDQLKDLIDCWDVFYKFLPDGEYRGMGQIRAAFNQHRERAGKSREAGNG